MAPTRNNPSSKANLEPDEILQAVIIADSFDEKFMPLTLDLPRCLIPLCNVPLIEYSLEALSSAGIQEIFILCCAHADQIVSYIKHSKWSSIPHLKVFTIFSSELISIGDALRDLDAKQVLKNDFILVSGDMISNMDLVEALNRHKTIKDSDKNCIMTMVMKSVGPQHRSRQKGNESLYVLDAKTDACLYYSPLEHFPKKHFKQIPLENLKKHNQISFRTDLVDAQIDICTLEVPALFTENFDYQDIRKDFVRGILESDLLGKTIYCYTENQQYVNRVHNTASYDAVSKDVMRKWAYPMSPDSPIFNHPHDLVGTSVYKGQKVFLARSANLKDHVVIGSGTSVGENTVVRNSVIGPNCTIGSNVILENTYVWENVVIGNQVDIQYSIIGNNVDIKENVKIGKGCLICGDVVIGKNSSIPEFSRIYLPEKYMGDAKLNVDLVGKDGKGALWENEYDEDEDLRNIIYGEFARDMTKILYQEEALKTDSEPDMDESEDEFDEEAEKRQIEMEIKATFDRAVSENHSPEIAALELNTLKMALNITFHDLRKVLLPKLITLIDLFNVSRSTEIILKKWSSMIKKFVHDESDQMDCIGIIANFCNEQRVGKVDYDRTFVPLLKCLYDLDIVEEDSIIEWYEESDSEYKILRKSATILVDWLQNAEEESSDED